MTDHELGSPTETILLASATFTDHDKTYVDVYPRLNVSPRADMTYLEYPNDGAVFSVSSISWCGCLSSNGYDNNVSRITRNVLERFSS